MNAAATIVMPGPTAASIASTGFIPVWIRLGLVSAFVNIQLYRSITLRSVVHRNQRQSPRRGRSRSAGPVAGPKNGLELISG